MLEIAGYELIEKIADGGMATVWKARQLSLDRMVAIKILGKSSLPDQEARDRFRKEAQTAARLNHPGIVQVFDAGEVNGEAYLVMEIVNGESVGDHIHLHGEMNEARALEITESVGRALAYAWEKECLIHCDINPNNILIDRTSGVVKVADLGLARMIGIRPSTSDNDMIIGTPNYTSPEQSAGISDLDCRADIYSLGATLYHMVTGSLPFHDAKGSQAMTRHEEDFLEDPQVVNPELSAPTAWLIEKMMIKNRALRSHFWTQNLKDIEEVRRGRMPHPPLPDVGASTVRRSNNRTLVTNTKPNVVVLPKAGSEPKKLILKKSDLPVTSSPPVQEENQTAAALRYLGFFLVLAVAVYGVLLFHGKVKGPPLPFQPVVQEEEATEEEYKADIDWDDEVEAAPAESADFSQNADFIKGARLFNQALADYTTYQETRANPEILAQVEANCREAITYFEACRAAAPAEFNIDQYINQSFGLIANVRHSTVLDDGNPKVPASTKSAVAETKPAEETRKVTFIDDEPAPVQIEEEFEPEAEKTFLTVALKSGWNNPGPGSPVYGRELGRLLMRNAEPSTDNEVDSATLLYPGITCMMTAKDAAKQLGHPLPIRRALETPCFPTASFYYYQFAGDFSGAGELTLVCDQNDRVVMAQLYDSRVVPARLEAALFSVNWSVYDFIGARMREESDGTIAHRVRRRDNVIRLDTELAVNGAANGDRMVKARVALMMPVQLAGLILQVTQTSR